METLNPVAVSPAVAHAALERHLPLVLKGRTLEEAGWKRPDPLTLLIPLLGRTESGTEDAFLLRLNFACYPDARPRPQFINPETLAYDHTKDARYLPRIEGTNEIQVHVNYAEKHGQLICCSNTLEFYLVRHGVQPMHVWDGKVMTFAATLNAIRRGLTPAFYKGRHG